MKGDEELSREAPNVLFYHLIFILALDQRKFQSLFWETYRHAMGSTTTHRQIQFYYGYTPQLDGHDS